MLTFRHYPFYCTTGLLELRCSFLRHRCGVAIAAQNAFSLTDEEECSLSDPLPAPQSSPSPDIIRDVIRRMVTYDNDIFPAVDVIQKVAALRDSGADLFFNKVDLNTEAAIDLCISTAAQSRCREWKIAQKVTSCNV